MAAVLEQRWAQWKSGRPFVPLNRLVFDAPLSPCPIAEMAMPPREALLDRMQDALRRFLGFEALLADDMNAPTRTDTLLGRRFYSEYPGGCHWVELLAMTEPAEGGTRYGFTIDVRSRILALAKEMAAIEIPGFAKTAEDVSDVYDTAYLYLDRWWDAGPELVAGPDGQPLVPLRHPDEIAPALEHLSRQAETRLRKLLRQFETAKSLEAITNPDPIFHSPIFARQRMIQNVFLAEKFGNPRLLAICDEVEDVLDTLPAQPDLDALRVYLRRVRARNSAR
jgi:hypothetical protein